MSHGPLDPQRGAMRRRARKLLAILATLAGCALAGLEVFRTIGGGGQAGVGWFWIGVAGLLVALGVAELADRSPRPPSL